MESILQERTGGWCCEHQITLPQKTLISSRLDLHVWLILLGKSSDQILTDYHFITVGELMNGLVSEPCIRDNQIMASTEVSFSHYYHSACLGHMVQQSNSIDSAWNQHALKSPT